MENIALLGFGTVGYGTYEILQGKENLNVKYVLDLVPHDDITATSVTDINVILNDTTVTTVVELIGGHHPAYEFIKSSLNAKKNVITANKLVICEHYSELTTLAKENGVALRFTAAVGGGIPWLINLERIINVSKVNNINGIFNGTTNYILDSMHKNDSSFEAALKKAQELGYAEADPSSDIDGLDTKRKIAISANIAFGVSVDHNDIDVIGIRNVSSDDIKDFENHGYVCRLIASTENNGGQIAAFVEPTIVKEGTQNSGITESYNRISVHADNVKDLSFTGYGAGRYPTAFTVVADCIDVANGVKKTYNKENTPVSINNDSVKHKYYIRTSADSDYLTTITADKWDCGIVTSPITVSEAHKLYKALLIKDDKAFIAAVKE